MHAKGLFGALHFIKKQLHFMKKNVQTYQGAPLHQK